jgi:predicted enzyme related to lactoylglutathione lyase
MAQAQRAKTESAADPTSSHGRFCWNELMTHDLARAKKFYQDTLGWSFEPMAGPGMTYWLIKMGDAAASVGGIFEMKGPEFANVPEHWMPYIAVDDVDARLKKAVAAGATVCREPFDVPDVGRIAILSEPGGAMIGWITPKR